MRTEAQKKALRDWKRRNPEKVRADKREWGRRSYAKNPSKFKRRAKLFRLKNPSKVRAWAKEKHLRVTYGLTLEKVSAMLKKQQGNCGICKHSLKKPHVDHCHTSGKVRGLLCQKCNLGIGLFSDSVVNLSSAIQYLKNHSTK